MKLFLFDVDQTLISTGGAGIRALNRACHRLLNLENAMSGIQPHGKTDPAIVREIFAVRNPAGDDFLSSVDRIIDEYLAFLRNEVDASQDYRVLPGISAILDHLATRNDVVLGLATGNVERGARIKLERGNLNQYFHFGGYGSDSESRPELVRQAARRAVEHNSGVAIEPSNIFVIGDTPRDIEAGQAAGFQTVGVATGKYSLAELAQCQPTLAVTNFERGADQFLRTAFTE